MHPCAAAGSRTRPHRTRADDGPAGLRARRPARLGRRRAAREDRSTGPARKDGAGRTAWSEGRPGTVREPRRRGYGGSVRYATAQSSGSGTITETAKCQEGRVRHRRRHRHRGRGLSQRRHPRGQRLAGHGCARRRLQRLLPARRNRRLRNALTVIKRTPTQVAAALGPGTPPTSCAPCPKPSRRRLADSLRFKHSDLHGEISAELEPPRASDAVRVDRALAVHQPQTMEIGGAEAVK
jgi:hypothetical protein